MATKTKINVNETYFTVDCWNEIKPRWRTTICIPPEGNLFCELWVNQKEKWKSTIQFISTVII